MTTPNETPTPRTDIEECLHSNEDCAYDNGNANFVPASFARILERELVEANAKLAADSLLVENTQLKTDLEEFQALFDLQYARCKEADKLWRKATKNPGVVPDLGVLLTWLMAERDELVKTRDAQLEQATQWRTVATLLAYSIRTALEHPTWNLEVTCSGAANLAAFDKLKGEVKCTGAISAYNLTNLQKEK